MSTSACTLFVGDLSIYCTRNDLEGAFAQFGPIKDIRIKRDEETQKNLSYGFVEFEHISSAVNALQNMNGFVLCGRPMRMRWAANKSKKSMNTPYGTPAPAPRSESDETSAVHVTYMALHPNIIVTEESLRYIFSNYGLVLDATIKKSVANQDGSGRRGYGFVHFANTQDGVESAIKAATAMANATVHDVHYRCCMSKAFEQRLSSMMQHYRTLSPLEAYSMNCYYFNQHQQQAMMYAAALSQQVQQQQSAFFAAAPIRQQVVQEQMQQVKPVVMQQQMPAPPQQQQQGCYFPIVNVGNFSYPAAVAAPPAPVYSAPRYVTAHSLLARQNMHLEQALNASDESKSYTPEPKAAVAPAVAASAETNDLCAAMEKVAIAADEEKKVEAAAVTEIALPAAKAAPEVYRKPEPAVTATSKGLDTMATVSELQAQLDQLRSTVGATRASEFATKDVLVEAEALVHCVDLCDY